MSSGDERDELDAFVSRTVSAMTAGAPSPLLRDGVRARVEDMPLRARWTRVAGPLMAVGVTVAAMVLWLAPPRERPTPGAAAPSTATADLTPAVPAEPELLPTPPPVVVASRPRALRDVLLAVTPAAKAPPLKVDAIVIESLAQEQDAPDAVAELMALQIEALSVDPLSLP